MVSELCIALGTFLVTDPHPDTIVAEDMAARDLNGENRISCRTVELEVTELVFAQLTCPRSFRQLVEVHEGGCGLTRFRHVRMLSMVDGISIVVCLCCGVWEYVECSGD